MYPEFMCGDCWARAIVALTEKTIAANRKRHGIVIIVVLIRFTLITRSRGALGPEASLPARFKRSPGSAGVLACSLRSVNPCRKFAGIPACAPVDFDLFRLVGSITARIRFQKRMFL